MEIAHTARRPARKAGVPLDERGYAKLYRNRVMQSDRACDLDFPVGTSGAPVPRESH